MTAPKCGCAVCVPNCPIGLTEVVSRQKGRCLPCRAGDHAKGSQEARAAADRVHDEIARQIRDAAGIDL